MSYFPLFIDLKNKKVLIIGAGKIARHKIDLLKEFEADINPKLNEQLKELEKLKGRHYEQLSMLTKDEKVTGPMSRYLSPATTYA